MLIISTESRLAPGFVLVDQLILKALGALKVRTETHAENLDVIRMQPERSQQIFTEYLNAKYARDPPDVVILVVVGLTEEDLDMRGLGPS